MWRILKAEIVYNKTVFLYIFVSSLFSFIGIHHWPIITNQTPSNTNMGYISLSHMLFFFIWSILIALSLSRKEKRMRQQVLLPVSVRQIGIVRMMIYLTYWIVLVILFFNYNWISDYFSFDIPTLLSLCSQTGMAFIVYSIIFYWSDLSENVSNSKSLFNIPNRKLVGLFTLFLILFFCFIAMAGIVHTYQTRGNFSEFDRLLSWIYQSETGVFFFFLIGLGLSSLSLITFMRRRSYVES